MRKRNVLIIAGIMIFIAGLLCSIFMKEKERGIDYLEGQWKITELEEIPRAGIIYWSEEEYLGRSISISSGQVERSIGYWPVDLNRRIRKYEYWTHEQMTGGAAGAREWLLNQNGWYDKYGDEIVTVISFYHTEDDFKKGYDCAEIYIIFQDGSVQTNYVAGFYAMERFIEAKVNLSIEELWGKWNVERFVSYQDDWIGNRKQLEACKTNLEASFDPILTGWENAEGIDFYPKDYYGSTLQLDEEKMSLMSGDKIVEEHRVQQYEEQQLDKKIYEEEKGIHDELGITNEKIEVITATFDNKNEDELLDNEIVVVDETKIIIKIDHGWFLLTRDGGSVQ